MLTDEQIARVAYAANDAYIREIGDEPSLPWEIVRASIMAGVEHARANPAAAPSASHESWLSHKERDGWRYGPIKDASKKEHPCCVPYDMLPPAQRVKDALFLGVVRALLTSPMENG